MPYRQINISNRANKCRLFCQNYQISHNEIGEIIDIETLALYFLELEEKGANNINLVSASHVIYPILKAFKITLNKGFNLPIVYNTNGYDTKELLDCLDGIVDIYLPDLKYLFDNFDRIRILNCSLKKILFRFRFFQLT